MSEKGWICIDRKLEDHWLWSSRPFGKGQAWIDLLMLANHKGQTFYSGGRIIDGKRGVVYRSLKSLADRWGWDRKTVRGFLKLLEKDGMVTTESTTQGTTITIVNYDVYQDIGTTNRTTESPSDWTTMGRRIPTPTDDDGTTMGQRFPTYNNYNHDNNIGIGYNFTSLAEAVGPEAPLPTEHELYQIVSAWNQIPHAIKITSIVPMTKRYDQIRAAAAVVGMDGVMQAIQSVKDSDWLADKGHVAFDQWITPDRVQPLIEGAYKDRFEREEESHGSFWDYKYSDEGQC